jgi:TetR/AcrR family transcriptional regulator, cholesterol catabolism regulator
LTEKQKVYASVKDKRLVKIRREQMIKGAISLFKEKGFHRTTTREIARQAGFSIGTLYEYIRSKEDILYLVCDQIYDEVQTKIQEALDLNHVTIDTIREGIASYFRIVDEMQDEVLVMYQEAKSLSKETLPYVLKKEIQMVAMFEQLIKLYSENNGLSLKDHEIKLLAHNIFVQGQMWGFRRWALKKIYSLEEYTNMQTEIFIQGMHTFSQKNGKESGLKK